MSFPHRFYFLRHGETAWNRARRTQGQLESELNDAGRAQAARAAELLAHEPITAIIASPLSRARHTAEAVAAHHEVPLTFDDGLMACHLGGLQGGPHGPWLADYWTGDFDPPGGETFYEFSDRAWSAMRAAVTPSPNRLIVAHGGLWLAAHRFTRIEPPLVPPRNANPIRITPHADGWAAEQLGD